jgi:hypothetical protein
VNFSSAAHAAPLRAAHIVDVAGVAADVSPRALDEVRAACGTLSRPTSLGLGMDVGAVALIVDVSALA